MCRGAAGWSRHGCAPAIVRAIGRVGVGVGVGVVIGVGVGVEGKAVSLVAAIGLLADSAESGMAPWM